MELNWINDFLALAEHRNFSRAADARNVTQPAFSRRIRLLEDWVGTPLVLRSPHGAELNAAGEYLREHAIVPPAVDETPSRSLRSQGCG